MNRDKVIWKITTGDIESMYKKAYTLDEAEVLTEKQLSDVQKIADHAEKWFNPYEWYEQLEQFVDETDTLINGH